MLRDSLEAIDDLSIIHSLAANHHLAIFKNINDYLTTFISLWLFFIRNFNIQFIIGLGECCHLLFQDLDSQQKIFKIGFICG